MRIAINGYGRIGRCVLRAWQERRANSAMQVKATEPSRAEFLQNQPLQIVAINELADASAIAYLTRYDSTHGRFPGSVSAAGNTLQLDSQSVQLYREADAAQLPWREQAIDLLLDCSGQASDQGASKHLDAGAAKVLLSNPGNADIPALVYGINHKAADRQAAILSAASCTSNALVPVLSVLNNAFGIVNGVVTTIHAAMHDQPVIDAFYSDDLRRNRAASESIIPVATELASGIGRVLPELEGRFVAHALRVPVTNVSALNVTINFSRLVTETAVNQALVESASGELTGILGYTEEPIASCDFNHDDRSCIVDASQTRVSGDYTANILIWFDNEWAFANRMLDLAEFLCEKPEI